jgi:hypothetical protein
MRITKSAAAIVGLRSMRGYSAAKDDGKSAAHVKSLRRQFGQNYDVNSAGNISHFISTVGDAGSSAYSHQTVIRISM